MKFDKIVEILASEGYKKEIVYNDSEIREIEDHPGDDYYVLFHHESTWKLILVCQERGPYEKIIGVYASREDGAKSFFLNRLGSFYLKQYISHIFEVLGVNHDRSKLNFADLMNAMKHYNIPERYLSTKTLCNHSVKISEEKDGWISEYLDINGKTHERTIPLVLSECISYSFSRILFIYLLDEVTKKYLNGTQSFQYFTPDEIAAYLV